MSESKWREEAGKLLKSIHSCGDFYCGECVDEADELLARVEAETIEARDRLWMQGVASAMNRYENEINSLIRFGERLPKEKENEQRDRAYGGRNACVQIVQEMGKLTSYDEAAAKLRAMKEAKR